MSIYIDTTIPAGYDKLVPIVFATNDSYSIYAAVAIESILKNAGRNIFYRIYILHDGLSQEHIDGLESMGSAQLAVKCLNIGQYVEEKADILYVSGHITREAYYRFFIAELFSCYEKVIYLDCDLVVCGDVAELLSVDMGENYIAGVVDWIEPSFSYHTNNDLGLAREKYINSGVLVIDINNWNKHELTGRLFSALEQFPKDKLIWHDQDILNLVCKDRIFYLGDEWNFFGAELLFSQTKREVFAERIGKVKDNFKILHFPGLYKPWAKPDLPFANMFWEYARETSFLYEIVCREYAKWEYRGSYYENTTCWRITKPLRILGDLHKKLRSH